MTERERVLLECGFVLHQRPYRNSSQLLECLTAEHGRVGLVARGSRGARNGQRALLQPFMPLRLSWMQSGELGRLLAVEPDAAALELEAASLLAAYYVNELLLRLVARGDPNEPIFSCYSQCLFELAAGRSVARVLRLFEYRFLQALGYGLELQYDIESGEPLNPDGRYLYESERGPRLAADRVAEERAFWGRELIALRSESLDDDASIDAAKRLLGSVLKEHLGERPLKTRLVLKDILARGL